MTTQVGRAGRNGQTAAFAVQMQSCSEETSGGHITNRKRLAENSGAAPAWWTVHSVTVQQISAETISC